MSEEVKLSESFVSNQGSQNFLKSEISKLQQKSGLSLIQLNKNEVSTTQKIKNEVIEIEDDAKSFFTRVGQGFLAFFKSCGESFQKLKEYIFAKNSNNESWVDLYLYPFIKIFGILSILIIVIVLSKVIVSKFSASIVNKARNDINIDTIRNFGNISIIDNSRSEKTVVKGDSNNQNSQKTVTHESKDSIKIKGRKKKMPNNLNYNELFTTISVKNDDATSKNKKDENDVSNMDEFLERVSAKEKYIDRNQLIASYRDDGNNDLILFETQEKNKMGEIEEENTNLLDGFRELDRKKQQVKKTENKHFFQQTLLSEIAKK